MRRVNDFAEKSASSIDARSSVADSSRITYRRSSPGAEEDSVCAEITFHSAPETVATSAKRIAALNLRTVLVDQSLKPWIVSQRVPNRIYSQTLYGDSARSVQQSVQDFNRATVVAKNGVNFGHSSRNFRAAKGVFALRKQFGGAPRFSQRGIFFSEKSEDLGKLNKRVGRIGTLFQLRFEEAFCLQEGGPRAGFVLERFSRKPDEIIFSTQFCGNRCEEIVWQAFRFAQSFFVFSFQKKNVRSRAGDPKFFLVVHRHRFHGLKCFLRNAQIAFFGDSQLGLDLPKSHPCGVNLEAAVDRFISCIEISQHLIIESEILQHPAVFRI